MTLRELNQLHYLQREIELDRERTGAKIEERELECERLKAYIEAIPDSQTRQIFKLKFAAGLSWRGTASKIGGGNTAEGVRKRVYRYLKSNK